MRLAISLARFLSYFLAKVSYKQRIAHLFGIRTTEVRNIYQEINNSEFMHYIIKRTGLKKSFFNFSMSSVLRAPTLYVLCRILKPEIVVETGVADGFSSAFILQALETNKKGHLYSIDLPNQPGQKLRYGKTTGWLVPESLKNRWTLILGSSKEKLTALLINLKSIDIFYHDSDHSYENMMFELTVTEKYLNPQGILIADDIIENNAFAEFCKKSMLNSVELFKSGIIKR